MTIDLSAVPLAVRPYLPVLVDTAGKQVDYALFDSYEHVPQRHNGCRMRYIGTTPLKLSSITSATGYIMPIIPGAQFATECFIEIPNLPASEGMSRPGLFPGKVRAAGNVIRNGAVVTDSKLATIETITKD